MFENIKNFADLKKAYHKAARENHPDLGGDLETMKRINNDFERAAKRIDHAPAEASKRLSFGCFSATLRL